MHRFIKIALSAIFSTLVRVKTACTLVFLATDLIWPNWAFAADDCFDSSEPLPMPLGLYNATEMDPNSKTIALILTCSELDNKLNYQARSPRTQATAIPRLFKRYPRLTPRRLYTVTPNRVKIRQLPGAAQA